MFIYTHAGRESCTYDFTQGHVSDGRLVVNTVISSFLATDVYFAPRAPHFSVIVRDDPYLGNL